MYMKQKGLHFALYGLTCNTDITILETSYAVSYLYWDNQIFRFLTEKKNKTQQEPKRGGMQVRVRKTPLLYKSIFCSQTTCKHLTTSSSIIILGLISNGANT